MPPCTSVAASGPGHPTLHQHPPNMFALPAPLYTSDHSCCELPGGWQSACTPTRLSTHSISESVRSCFPNYRHAQPILLCVCGRHPLWGATVDLSEKRQSQHQRDGTLADPFSDRRDVDPPCVL
jgi:hypothetical protein